MYEAERESHTEISEALRGENSIGRFSRTDRKESTIIVRFGVWVCKRTTLLIQLKSTYIINKLLL